jgi:hypothetical protein
MSGCSAGSRLPLGGVAGLDLGAVDNEDVLGVSSFEVSWKLTAWSFGSANTPREVETRGGHELNDVWCF